MEWKNRPLHTVYPIVFIDCVHFNVKEDNMVVKKAAYIVLGVTEDGFKEELGIWIGENETSKFWLSVLTDLKTRGIKDILIVCSDGLPGLKQSIETVFPNAVQQRCIVHLIRNSCRYISYKDRKEFCGDLRKVYTASKEKVALNILEEYQKKWSGECRIICVNEKLRRFFFYNKIKYNLDNRKVIKNGKTKEKIFRNGRKIN